MRKIIRFILAVPIFVLVWLAIVRVIRYFVKFPMPQFMAPIIDNPFRRRFQPPEEMAWRHGLEDGMRVLEVGPGNGRYTLAAAQRVGENGRVVAVDIEPKMIRRLNERVRQERVTNVDGLIADVYNLPFHAATIDAAYMITVIGEIPDQVRAMGEIQRVLQMDGTLAFSEFFPDPDYPTQRSLTRRAAEAGFTPCYRAGSWFSYTLVFEKRA